jgi:flagellar basal-body rod protein FlgC
MTDIFSTLSISGAGMRTQNERIRVIAQNIANADTGPTRPGENPYRRQIISFRNHMDRTAGEKLVQVDKVSQDNRTEFEKKYLPGHPAADADGYVMMPNINPLVETMDMREASRTYEANIGMFTQTRDMMNRTIDILR